MATGAPAPKDASPITAALHRAVLTSLPFADTQDFDEPRRGLVATLPEVEMKNDQGRVVWSLRDYAFLADEQAPPTVNPSLWRLARLNLIHGLFQVTDRIHQIRGFDISNMTVIEGDRGLIVIDPLVSTEVAPQRTPETEAPAAMHMFYPALRALNLAENATHNLHNVYPIRGAQVRDANAWAKYLNEARDRFGGEVEVAFAQHHWPVWGTARVLDFLGKQRDLYKFLHDQTVRLMNHGYKAVEIAERLTLPRSRAATWHVRGYYGTLSHNAKSVYQRYVGWYDANPANLNPLPPVERGR